MNKKGFISLPIVMAIVLVAVVIGAGGYFLINGKLSKTTTSPQPISVQLDWKVYQDKVYGFQLKTPPLYTVTESDNIRYVKSAPENVPDFYITVYDADKYTYASSNMVSEKTIDINGVAGKEVVVRAQNFFTKENYSCPFYFLKTEKYVYEFRGWEESCFGLIPSDLDILGTFTFSGVPDNQSNTNNKGDLTFDSIIGLYDFKYGSSKVFNDVAGNPIFALGDVNGDGVRDAVIALDEGTGDAGPLGIWVSSNWSPEFAARINYGEPVTKISISNGVITINNSRSFKYAHELWVIPGSRIEVSQTPTDWKLYQDLSFGFQLNHPKDLSVLAGSEGSVSFVSPASYLTSPTTLSNAKINVFMDTKHPSQNSGLSGSLAKEFIIGDKKVYETQLDADCSPGGCLEGGEYSFFHDNVWHHLTLSYNAYTPSKLGLDSNEVAKYEANNQIIKNKLQTIVYQMISSIKFVGQNKTVQVNFFPIKVGQCQATTVKEIGSRLEGGPVGSWIGYANGGGQVYYDLQSSILNSRVGDPIDFCLISIPDPAGCPPGDDRGRVYRTKNHRTNEEWTGTSSSHGCGGA